MTEKTGRNDHKHITVQDMEEALPKATKFSSVRLPRWWKLVPVIIIQSLPNAKWLQVVQGFHFNGGEMSPPVVVFMEKFIFQIDISCFLFTIQVVCWPKTVTYIKKIIKAMPISVIRRCLCMNHKLYSINVETGRSLWVFIKNMDIHRTINNTKGFVCVCDFFVF